MLTGDNRLTAQAIREELGIAEAISDVLPTDKEACVRALQEKGHKVAMVGDGRERCAGTDARGYRHCNWRGNGHCD